MIVQPLETDTSGKVKLYERTGPQEFVKFVIEEVTIENIKKHAIDILQVECQ